MHGLGMGGKQRTDLQVKQQLQLNKLKVSLAEYLQRHKFYSTIILPQRYLQHHYDVYHIYETQCDRLQGMREIMIAL